MRFSYHIVIAFVLTFFTIMLPTTSHAATFDFNKIKESLQAKKETLIQSYQWNNELPLERIQKEAALKQVNIQDEQMESLFVTGNAIGEPGDILVTLDGTSAGFEWAGGHTGVVSDVPGYVVESFGNKSIEKNGVRHWVNDWKTRYKKVKALWVEGATLNDYAYAASYNREQIGKAYNYNFFNIKTTTRFYCSQLVWRAWYNRGWDLNYGGSAVWPVDLIKSPHTIAYYSQG
ncbi:YiiX/YebB-like N1pC/P60 family cysteine hydrolase [Shimazuella kribbensis]|uniref:YiiX/YebB-like N1pC/P60 family cysteine hydrolase n=1 Tax=Shimazuella kribbensis TaxID=139808 RepID=UPI0003FC02E3|nr:YiiX/YebB-like N1pC/P60 family cysteine hydrolase [Shimazuella kribbensis]